MKDTISNFFICGTNETFTNKSTLNFTKKLQRDTIKKNHQNTKYNFTRKYSSKLNFHSPPINIIHQKISIKDIHKKQTSQQPKLKKHFLLSSQKNLIKLTAQDENNKVQTPVYPSASDEDSILIHEDLKARSMSKNMKANTSAKQLLSLKKKNKQEDDQLKMLKHKITRVLSNKNIFLPTPQIPNKNTDLTQTKKTGTLYKNWSSKSFRPQNTKNNNFQTTNFDNKISNNLTNYLNHIQRISGYKFQQVPIPQSTQRNVQCNFNYCFPNKTQKKQKQTSFKKFIK